LTNAVVARFVELSVLFTVTPVVAPIMTFEMVNGVLQESDEGVTDSVFTSVKVNNPGVMDVSLTSFTRIDFALKSAKVVI
jgi:hypothetical protein